MNNRPIVGNAKKLFNGDIIFIMGMKIVIINDTIYINNPQRQVQLNDKVFERISSSKIDFNKKINNETLINKSVIPERSTLIKKC